MRLLPILSASTFVPARKTMKTILFAFALLWMKQWGGHTVLLPQLYAMRAANVRGSAVLGHTKEGRPLKLHYFPGKSDKNILLVGGVHGSELSSVVLAELLREQLSVGFSSEYNIWIIPCLFPDNAMKAIASGCKIGNHENIGRYSGKTCADPNRQMPPPGKAYETETPHDHAGRLIEPENQLLLKIIQELAPERIISLHAIRDTKHAGIFADPRTTCTGMAYGYGPDSTLAIETARHILRLDGDAWGNHPLQHPTTLYVSDPPIAAPGCFQPRKFHGSKLPGNIGYGVSLGTWATTDVCNEKKEKSRNAAMLFTIEFPGSKRPEDYHTAEEKSWCRKNIYAYASAIRNVLLQ